MARQLRFTFKPKLQLITVDDDLLVLTDSAAQPNTVSLINTPTLNVVITQSITATSTISLINTPTLNIATTYGVASLYPDTTLYPGTNTFLGVQASASLGATVSLIEIPTLNAAVNTLGNQNLAVSLISISTFGVTIARGSFSTISLTCTPILNALTSQFVPSVQIGQAAFISLHLLNPDGSYRCRLLDYQDLTINRQVASPGSFTFRYPSFGGNFAALREFIDQKKRCDVVAWLVTSGTKFTIRATLMEASWDDVDPLQVWTFNGFLQEHNLNNGILLPVAANSTNGGSTVYNGATPGALILNAVGGMQSRGTLTNLTTSTFTAARDSNGVSWLNTLTATFNPGATLADILNELVNQGLLQYEVTSLLELKIYAPSSWGTDKTIIQPALTLKSSNEVIQAPHKYSAVDVATKLVAVGAKGLNSTQNNANELALLGTAIEKFVSVGSLTTQSQLDAYAQLQVSHIGDVAEEISHGLNLHNLAPMPLQDFNLGDWVYSDTPFSASKSRLQVAQWTLNASSLNELSGTVTLNTLFYTQAVAFNRLLKRMLNGTVNVGISTPSSGVAPVKDGITPVAPTDLNGSSIAYLSEGNPPNILSEVTVTWAAPTLRSDGSALTDLLGYRVRYQLQNRTQESGGGAPVALITPTWYVVTPDGGVSGTSWTFGNVLPGAVINLQVAAFDTAYEQGPWSTSYVMTTQNNIIAPPIPSTPIVTTWFKTLNINWDGNTNTGAAMLTAYRLFDHIEVHASTVTGFTSTTATLREVIYAAPGVTNIILDTYDTYFIKFIAVANITSGGLKSQASAQASGSATPAIGQDIGNQIISAVKLTDNQPLGPKIASQQISTPHLTVATFSDSLLPNGGFDDAELLGSALPAYWTVGTNSNPTNTLIRDTVVADTQSGAACAKISLAAATDSLQMLSAVIDCKPGDNFYFELTAMASRALNGLSVSVLTGPTSPPVTLTSLSGGNFVVPAAYPTAPVTFNYNVPSVNSPNFIRLLITAGGVIGDAAAVNIFIDSVRARKVVGTAEIQDAAISRAKISILAVDSARIASVDVGTLVSGTMTASVTISGIIRTSQAFPRAEMDGAGIRLYNSGGTNMVNLSANTGAATIIGEYRTALSARRIAINPGGSSPDHIYIYPSGSGDFANIFTRDAVDGSAAILIDGGAVANVGRGRVGAYKQQAFISYVVQDSGGSAETGYSETAVVCNDQGRVFAWCQTSINFDLYQGSAVQNMGHMQFQWASGGQGSFNPMLSAGGSGGPNCGVKFDSSILCSTFADGLAFAAMKCSALTQTSTEAAKSDIIDARYTMNPIQQIKRARSKSWKYKDEITRYGNDAPVHFGPVAEDLSKELIFMTPAPRGGGLEASVSLGDQVGILWAAMNQIIDELESHGVPMPTRVPFGIFLTVMPRLMIG